MRTIRVALQIAVATTLAMMMGCSTQPTRAVTGQLRTAGMQLDNPVVIAEAADHRVFVTHVSARGTFKLQLPPGVQYRLTLANTTRSGAYVTVARINWPLASGPSRWANLGAGAPLDLGHVYRRGTSPAPATGGLGTACESCSGGSDPDENSEADDDGNHDDDDDCEQEDDAKIKPSGQEHDCDCDDEIDEQDNCAKDDDGDKHDQECDDDDQDDGDDDDGDDDDHDGKGCDAGCASTPPAGGGAGSGGACMVTADCASGLQCINSVCTTANTGVQ